MPGETLHNEGQLQNNRKNSAECNILARGTNMQSLTDSNSFNPFALADFFYSCAETSSSLFITMEFGVTKHIFTVRIGSDSIQNISDTYLHVLMTMPLQQKSSKWFSEEIEPSTNAIWQFAQGKQSRFHCCELLTVSYSSPVFVGSPKVYFMHFSMFKFVCYLK